MILEVRDRERRLRAVEDPDDAVFFFNGIRKGGNFRRIESAGRNRNALAVAGVPPMVKRTSEIIFNDGPFSQIGPEMKTASMKRVNFSLFAPKERDLPVEQSYGNGFSFAHLARIGQHVPALGSEARMIEISHRSNQSGLDVGNPSIEFLERFIAVFKMNAKEPSMKRNASEPF